jgi:hypothetical protein
MIARVRRHGAVVLIAVSLASTLPLAWATPSGSAPKVTLLEVRYEHDAFVRGTRNDCPITLLSTSKVPASASLAAPLQECARAYTKMQYSLFLEWGGFDGEPIPPAADLSRRLQAALSSRATLMRDERRWVESGNSVAFHASLPVAAANYRAVRSLFVALERALQ